MTAPRRLVDDPNADPSLQRLLGRGGGARPLDDLTRRRLRVRVARAAALPAVAAWWLFMKSALAALGAVGAVATAATATGIIEWRSTRPAQPAAPKTVPRAPQGVAPLPAPAPSTEQSDASEPAPGLNPAPTLPNSAAAVSSAPAGASLAAESILLEQARRKVRRSPALALQIADEHAARFPRGQLTAERTLLQVEALHRLGRAAEARLLAGPLLKGASGELYRERARRLIGERETH